MPISSGTRTRNLLATAILLALSNAAMATPTVPGVSHDLAVARAARLSNIRYRLSFTLKEHESAVAGTETLTFESRTAGDLSIDYRDGVIQSATLNARPIPKELENGHLNLPAIVGQNTLTLAFISNGLPLVRQSHVMKTKTMATNTSTLCLCPWTPAWPFHASINLT
jgi:aminopeptidase N